ncbi:HD domain-containing protein [Paraliomyxa miuraensis]|uniref:HD domain-containing protein n=1 Tax=Paraliomyxa miuraensis TaxID=376150 RepID=UPI002259E958|nr:HD domain-containing protein [Paraliomyxa miuraensis]MCX4246168.1 HD domain-containing protein [Paraliomyxa miuraensis]
MSLAPAIERLDPEELLRPLDDVAATGELPDPSLTAQIAAVAERVLELPPAVVYERLTPPLCGRNPHVVLQWLREAGLLVHLLPELDATHAFSQEGGRRHKDVWEHTKAVVRQSVPRPAVRWAAALHDIGKVTTRRFLPDGKVTFHGHSEEGVRMFRRGPVRRIGFPPQLRERVELLILHHLRAGQYDGSWTDGAVRRFHREMEPFLVDLLDLSRADVTSKRPGKRARCLRMIKELEQRIETLAQEDARPRPLPPGLGNLLMEALELPPGKHLAELRGRLEALCEGGELEGGREAEYYVEAVRARGLLEGLEIQPPRGWTMPTARMK